MDYETVGECFYELWTAGPHKEDVMELLRTEFESTQDLAARDRITLCRALDEVERSQAFGQSAPLQRAHDILIRYHSFEVKWIRVLADSLLNKR